MDSEKIYLDSCIFVAYLHEKHIFHQEVSDCMKNLPDFNVQLYSSEWALCEATRVLINDFGYGRDQAIKLINKIRTNSKIESLSIIWLEVDEDKFTFRNFIHQLNDRMLDVKGLHIADAIHEQIMGSNSISDILSTDKDFDVIKTITLISPKVLSKMRVKNRVILK